MAGPVRLSVAVAATASLALASACSPPRQAADSQPRPTQQTTPTAAEPSAVSAPAPAVPTSAAAPNDFRASIRVIDSDTAARKGAGLVEHHGVDALGSLQHLAPLDQHAHGGPASGADHDRRGGTPTHGR